MESIQNNKKDEKKMESIRMEKVIAGKKLCLSTGELARQANGSVLCEMGGTAVLGAVTMSSEAKNEGFFPLSVHYIEKGYAYGRIPGSFHRREGKPSDGEVVISRLIDRPLRPLFEKGFQNEVQVLPTVLSMDGMHLPDVLGIIASSAALYQSDIPFTKPIGAVRMGYIEGNFLVNPTAQEMKASSLELMIAGTKEAITMIEGHAAELPEEILLEAVERAHKVIVELVAFQEEFCAKSGKKRKKFLCMKWTRPYRFR